MSKLIGLVLVPFLFTLSFFILIGFIQPEIVVKCDGQAVNLQDSKPFMYDDGQNSSIVVPSDLFAAEMGAEVSIDHEKKSLTVKKNPVTMTFHDGSNIAIVNGKEKTMLIRALYKDNHFYTSVRFLAETLGKTVFWESKSSSINILDSVKNGFAMDKDAKSYISINRFSVNSSKLLFYKNGIDPQARPDYPLEEKLNPNINKQVYSLVNFLVDKHNYLNIDYRSTQKGTDPEPVPNVSLTFTKAQEDLLNNNFFFNFTFYEKTPVSPRKIWKYKNFSRNSVIKLELNKLYYGEKPEDGWIDQFYEDRLKLSLIALFQESTGLNICDYLLEEYKNIRNDTEGEFNNYQKTRRFDNVRVDLAYAVHPNSSGTIYVYFSY